MKRQVATILLIFLGAISFSGPAHSASVTWVVNAILDSYTEGVYGTFDYDPDTDTISNVNIEVQDHLGDVLDFFTDADVTSSSGAWGLELIMGYDSLADYTGSSLLVMDWDSAIESGDSFKNIIFGFWGVCDNAICNSAGSFGDIAEGDISAVPLPAAAWLFGSALLGLGVIKRRKTA